MSRSVPGMSILYAPGSPIMGRKRSVECCQRSERGQWWVNERAIEQIQFQRPGLRQDRRCLVYNPVGYLSKLSRGVIGGGDGGHGSGWRLDGVAQVKTTNLRA